MSRRARVSRAEARLGIVSPTGGSRVIFITGNDGSLEDAVEPQGDETKSWPIAPYRRGSVEWHVGGDDGCMFTTADGTRCSEDHGLHDTTTETSKTTTKGTEHDDQ